MGTKGCREHGAVRVGQPVKVGQGALYSEALQTGWVLGSVVSEGNLVELVVLQQLLEKSLAQRGDRQPWCQLPDNPLPSPQCHGSGVLHSNGPLRSDRQVLPLSWYVLGSCRELG